MQKPLIYLTLVMLTFFQSSSFFVLVLGIDLVTRHLYNLCFIYCKGDTSLVTYIVNFSKGD